jgi:hypothetical protein
MVCIARFSKSKMVTRGTGHIRCPSQRPGPNGTRRPPSRPNPTRMNGTLSPGHGLTITNFSAMATLLRALTELPSAAAVPASGINAGE